MSEQDGKHWYNKFLNDLKEWGVQVPEGISYDELKKIHKGAKKARADQGADTGHDVPDLNSAEDAPDQSDTDAVYAMFEQFMKQYESKKGRPLEGMTEERFEKMLLSVKEGKTDAKGHVRAGYVDPSDRIEPVKFFAPFVRYYVPEKFNGAYAEALPPGVDMLKFIPSFGYSVRIGDRTRRKYISILEVMNHGVYKYLTGRDIEGNKVGEAHHDFDRMFYIQPKKAFEISDNGMWAQIFKKHEHQLMAKKFSDLMTMARKYNLPTDGKWSKEQYAAALAEQLADTEIAGMKQQQTENLQRRMSERLLLKTQEGIDVGTVG